MKLSRATHLAVLACLLPAAVMAQSAAQPPAPAQESSPAPSVEFRFEVDPMLMCHFYLNTYGPSSYKPAPATGVDFVSEATAYSNAKGFLDNPEAWRWFTEKVAEGPDPAAVRLAAKDLPPQLQVDDLRTGINMLVDALESAYPKYMKHAHVRESAGINRIMISGRKRFLKAQSRLTSALMEQMAFDPIDAPIIIYVVSRTGGITTWGKSTKGYFTVIGVLGQSPLNLVETGIHEATHILDALQSPTSKSVLRECRKRSPRGSREKLEVFLHGLVAYNSGELVKRFMNRSYVHKGVLAPAHAADYRPYMSTYEYIWRDYLDGKMPLARISLKLLEEFATVQTLHRERSGS